MSTGQADARLTAADLIALYEQGWFPMAEPNGAIHVHRPDPRAIFDLDRIPAPDRPTRRLLERATVTMDTAFEEVMRRCAGRAETWIDERLIAAYTQLHQQGHARSLEVWLNDELVGGIYGVSLGAAFFGESLFGTNNAGKAGFHVLAACLREGGYRLFDSQYINAFTRSLGAFEIDAVAFDQRLRQALMHEARFPCVT